MIMNTPRRRPKVKICGLTTPQEAALAVDLGADLLGFNFYDPSPRAVSAQLARSMSDAARERNPDVEIVGVFVNHSRDEVAEIAETAALDRLQFHGDEPPEMIAAFSDRAIKVFRIRESVDAEEVANFGPACWGFLFDYKDPNLYGGSGRSWHFESLRALDSVSTLGSDRPALSDRPILIAGGLGPHNIRAALRASSAWGVDVCSGVESAPGRKDPELLRELFQLIEKEMDDGPPTAAP